MRQRLFIGSLFVFVTFLAFFLGHRWWERLNQPTVLCPGCNVIIIDIDTFRADAFDCKGKPGDSGYPPNLCEFVKDAFKFENNFSQSHWTLPSSVSTHTGLYPPEHGIEQYGDILPADSKDSKMVILPEVFLKNGYKSFIIGYNGKHYISNHSNMNRGYESVINSEDMTIWKNEAIKMNLSNSQFYTLFYSSALHAPYKLDDSNPLILDSSQQSIFPITQEEIDRYINDELITGRQKIFSENIPAVPKERLIDFFYSLRNDENKENIFLKDSKGKTKDRSIDKWSSIYFSMIHNMYLNKIKSSPDSAADLLKIYNAKVQEVDNDMGLFLNDLRKSEFFNNTVFVFMSDHGEAFFEHGTIDHDNSLSSQYNELIHVPLYIYVPGTRGRTIRSVTQNIDIFPTLFEIVGFDDFASIGVNHGKSLVPLMDGKRWWSNLQKRFAISFSGSLLSIQDNKWKMIADLCDDGRLEVYDLENDPKEKKNLAKSVTGVSRVLMDRLEETLGFSLKGLGINWKDRFGSNRNSSCFVN